ncbi:MAG: hypothetical protein IIZ67_05310 [Bacilli bacterium]|nr:hypothetical protein [Bacilli bacterium]
MNNVKFTSPFKKLCVTVGNLPTAYLESMSYYEALTYFVKYLDEMKDVVNNNSEVVEELKTFVLTYFDNLDVQEEVNKKLDEMAQDGTLAEIINQEIFGELNTKVTNLENQVKLSNVHEIELEEITGDTSIINNLYSGYIAWNSDSSWFKCFLYLNVTNDGTSKSITLPLPTGFTVTSEYYISYAGLVFTEGLFSGGASLHVTPEGINIDLTALNGTYMVLFNPYMYYNGVIES